MDFLVGGMPRGGTTAVAQLFNFHPDASCYAAESHLLPLMMEFAPDKPMPKGALKSAEKILHSQNTSVLIEMPRFSVSRGANAKWLLFDEADVALLNTKILGLLESGLYGAALCRACMGLFGDHIKARTGKAVIGEKSPPNVYAFQQFASLADKGTFSLLREPYAVINSMIRRGENAEDTYASPFRQETIGLIGLYTQYARAIRAAAMAGNTQIVTYDNLIAASEETVTTLFDAVGLHRDDTAIAAAANSVRPKGRGAPWAAMGIRDAALIWHLTKPIRAVHGFDEAYYDAKDFDVAIREAPIEISTGTIVPLYGLHPKSASEGGTWLAGDNAVAILCSNSARKLILKFWCELPNAGDGGDNTATLTALAPETKQKLAQTSVARGKAQFSQLEIDLQQIPPVYEGVSGRIYSIELSSSFSYRRTTTPLPIHKKLFFGGDRRELSFCLVDQRFE